MERKLDITKKKSIFDWVIFLIIIAALVYISASVIPGFAASAREGVALAAATFFLNFTAGLGPLGRLLGLLITALVIYSLLKNIRKILAALDRMISIGLRENPYRYDVKVAITRINGCIEQTGKNRASVRRARQAAGENAKAASGTQQKEYWLERKAELQEIEDRLTASLEALELEKERLLLELHAIPEGGKPLDKVKLQDALDNAGEAVEQAREYLQRL